MEKNKNDVQPLIMFLLVPSNTNLLQYRAQFLQDCIYEKFTK